VGDPRGVRALAREELFVSALRDDATYFKDDDAAPFKDEDAVGLS